MSISRGLLAAARNALAVVEGRGTIAEQRPVLEIRAATLGELGLGFCEDIRAREELAPGERKSLRSNVHALVADGHAAGRGRLPAVSRRARHPGRGPQAHGRDGPAHVADIGRAEARALEVV